MMKAWSIDFVCLNENGHHGDINIHFAAMREVHLLPWCELFRQCGFHLKIIDIDSYALSRVLLKATSIGHAQIVASIVIQEATATCVVFNNEEILCYETWDHPNHHRYPNPLSPCMGQGKWLSLHPVTKIFLDEDHEVEKNMFVSAQKDEQIEVCNLHWKPLFKQAIHNEANDNGQCALQLSGEYVFACGLSLREIPAW